MSAAPSTALIMRIADVQLSFPAILIALLVNGIAKSVFGNRLDDDEHAWRAGASRSA